MSQDHNKKQSVVFFSDIVGYTRLMGKDEDRAFALMKKNSEIHTEVLSKFRGQIIKELGDGILATFETVPEAIQASIEIQKKVQKMDNDVRIRIGLHCGEIIFDHGDVFGDAVNLTSRIQGIGIPSCLLISEKVQELIPEDSEFNTLKLGPFHLKNVEQAVQLYAVTNKPCAVPKRSEIIQNINYQEKTPWKFWTVLSITFILLAYLIYSIFWNQNIWEKEKSVAVLPFKDIIANPEHEFFAEALTEDIISHVSKIESIKVIDKNAAYEFENKESDLDSIAEVLDVSTILTGTVQWIGERIQINVQLVDPIENKNLWTETYNREVQDLFKVQTEIASKIATILNSKLSTQERNQISKEQTSNFEAYSLFLKGKEYYDYYDGDSLEKAVQQFKKAIALDPNYAQAYTGLASCYSQYAYYGKKGSWLDSSLLISEKALEIDPYLEEAYAARGSAYYYKGQIGLAQISFERARANNPNFSPAIGNLATVYMTQGKLVEAIQLQAKSASLNPTRYIPIQITGWIYRILDQPDKAMEWLERSNSVYPSAVTNEQMAYVYLEEGNKEKALKEIDEILKIQNDTSGYGYMSAGYVAFFANEVEYAEELLEKSFNKIPDSMDDPYYSAPIFLAYCYKVSGKDSLYQAFVNHSLEIRQPANQITDDDSNLWFDLAQLEAIKGDRAKALSYLKTAINFGYRDDFNILFNPIFKDWITDPKMISLLNEIDESIVEMNKKLQTIDLQRNR